MILDDAFTVPAGTSALEVIERLGWTVTIIPPTPRDELLARLVRALQRHQWDLEGDLWEWDW